MKQSTMARIFDAPERVLKLRVSIEHETGSLVTPQIVERKDINLLNVM